MGWMENVEKVAWVALRILYGMAEQASPQAGRAELQMAKHGKLHDGRAGR